MRKRVYISGPISKGDRNENFAQAAKAQIALMQAGYTTYNPMLSMANFASDECDWETWLECDEAWVAVSDFVLRLPGASLGAERELAFARRYGIPVVLPGYFTCLHDLFEDRRLCLPEDKGRLMRWLFGNRLDERLRADVAEGFARVS
jgi:hypothetical protein